MGWASAPARAPPVGPRVIELPAARVGPYVRALYAALSALAPGEDHVPLSAALDHVAALDPALGGGVLLPAEVVAGTGMPAFPWLERARAEAATLARGTTRDPDDAEIERARSLDPDLAWRMASRRDLHRHLRHAELLEPTHLGGAVRWVDPRHAMIGLAYDRIAPDGRWVRVRIEVEADRVHDDAIGVVDGRVRADDRLRHLLTRHFATDLGALRLTVESAARVKVVRVGRSWLGPFWFPGVALPAGVPPVLATGLVLHASTEILDPALRESRDLDPLEAEAAIVAPSGWGTYRERRFAAAGPVEALREWAATRGVRPLVVPIPPPGRARLPGR